MKNLLSAIFHRNEAKCVVPPMQAKRGAVRKDGSKPSAREKGHLSPRPIARRALCGRARPLESAPSARPVSSGETLDEMIASRPELAIEGYALTLYGVCSACREASGS